MLLTTYSSNNRVIDAALSVTYYKRLVQGIWVGSSLIGDVALNTYSLMSEYHRVARKTYKYIGMTLSAAQECAAAMKTIYTRAVSFQRWNSTASEGDQPGTWETLAETGTELSSEIVISHASGNGWEVTVNVNEDSIYMSRPDIVRSFETIFSAERARSYDGETES